MRPVHGTSALKKSTSTCDGDMENWFRDVGRATLLEALGDACDRVSDSFKTGINSFWSMYLSCRFDC